MKKVVVTFMVGKEKFTLTFKSAAGFVQWVRSLEHDVVVLRWRQL